MTAPTGSERPDPANEPDRAGAGEPVPGDRAEAGEPAGKESPAGTGSERLGPAHVVQKVWEGEDGLGLRLLGAVLTPAELGFRSAVGVRDLVYRTGIANVNASPVPAISVGNITVGGTGKTPMVRWVVRRLLAHDLTPGILHGGYAEDEPALHRRWFPDLPVVADRDRLRGAGVAMRRGAEVLVLDDAFQHRAFGRDLDLVLVSAETWTRYGRLLPRGPFRESPRALRRADMVIVTRRTATATEAALVEAEVAHVSRRPTARVHLRPGAWLDGLLRPRGHAAPPGPGVAVAGVARPDDFFDQTEEAGARLVDAIAFPDHHDYTRAEAQALGREAAGRPLVTTAKDAVKLAALLPDVELWVLDQDVTFESGRKRLTRAVDEVVK
ncbi:MAG: tetraacyldisaccharide 4'-kinase [Gemmatimonadota bacterium]